MPRTELLPDAVWAQLDPTAARLSKRTRRRMLLGAVTVAAVVVLAILAHLSGVVGPALGETDGGGFASRGSGQFSEWLHLHNGGWFSARLAAVEVDSPYAQLVRSRGGGATLEPGASADLFVTIRVTDCSHVTWRTEVPILLRVQRWWGTQTESVAAQNSQFLVRDACAHRH